MKVYVLQHTHAIDKDTEDEKLLGVYSSSSEATLAIQRFRQLPGFTEAPNGFETDEYTLDEDCWTEGYISRKEATQR